MNSEELKVLIEDARIKKGISQRELAKQTGISRSTLNDLINGKIKKADIDDLRKIAETLDMSLQKLVKAAGYDEMSLYFNKNKLKDRYYDQSSKDLKELLEQYKSSETDLLTFDSKKRDKAREVGFKLFDATEKLKWIKEGKEGYTLDQVIEQLTETQEMLDPIMNKYDYSKLPGRN
ncbi:MAG: helix-turn-helix transcriptional regulator [Bacilli bacterium]|nr:helix-turn-helix transcriptional regulator [Bacilli bacterium]